ncbi:MAG: DUF3488 and transglutaminase-like domain-containing protein [Wenzhouxiangellaceae bacterium]|nr:DUF3488 and transglutaminase-like domain-containing protein [Wenzhouxiangellaceae bacterium]
MTAPLSRTSAILVTAAFGVSALPHLAAMPWLPALAICAFVAWRMAAALRGWTPPARLLRIIVTMAGLGLIVMHYGTLWGRRAATAMLCMMMAAKLTETFRLRDGRVLAALCYFLVATQFLFDQQLGLLAYLFAAVVAATGALYSIQRDADRLPSLGPAATLAGASRVAGSLLVLALPFALVLFVLFPRLSSPLWGLPEQALDARTGLSDEMSPGTIAELFNDDRPAFRVTFDGPRPEAADLYWRGPVLWRFDGRTWSRLGFLRRSPERVPSRLEAPWRYRVQIEPSERRWLFALPYPAAWPDEARLSADFELMRETPVTTLTSYSVTSDPVFVDSPDLSPVLRRIALSLPEASNPRTRRFAADLRIRYPDDDRALIDAVLRWLNTEPFFYSLQTVPLGRDGADEFLFDLRTGYCEYYASSFAVLMRAAGIPARIVTGYQGGFWQAADEYLLVRHSDAHAWVEVWLPGSGWTRVDPTAAVSPERVLQGARSAVGDGAGWFGAEWAYALRNQYDRLRHLWNRWVLDFDAESQRDVFDRAGLQAIGPIWRGLFTVLLAAAVLVPLGLGFRAAVAALPRGSALERAWARLLGRLRRAGVPISPDRSPREVAEAAAGVLDNADGLRALVADYRLARYGPPGEAPADLRELARRLRGFRPRRPA